MKRIRSPSKNKYVNVSQEIAKMLSLFYFKQAKGVLKNGKKNY